MGVFPDAHTETLPLALVFQETAFSEDFLPDGARSHDSSYINITSQIVLHWFYRIFSRRRCTIRRFFLHKYRESVLLELTGFTEDFLAEGARSDGSS